MSDFEKWWESNPSRAFANDELKNYAETAWRVAWEAATHAAYRDKILSQQQYAMEQQLALTNELVQMQRKLNELQVRALENQKNRGLRDEFAAPIAANLAGTTHKLIANGQYSLSAVENLPEDVAATAYRIAEAMLKERVK